ncbi:MAG: SGNH/GDSL hydrolase family protein [Actinomycetota bacterium]|jgi:lysophospholipase L1-like esterase|nr:SGNH/GDSL hydrolase family protein [Actinomycetota bacterium]
MSLFNFKLFYKLVWFGSSFVGIGKRFSSKFFSNRLKEVILLVVLGVATSAASIGVALLLTPPQQVSVVGQTVHVGASAPSFSLSGPGQLDIFGQELPTALHFPGPIRPRLVLTHITLGSQLASVFASHHPNISAGLVGSALASGWTRYFIWETVVAGACSILLVGALAGWWRISWRRTLLLIATGLVSVEAVNLGAVMVTAYSVPSRLGKVNSLEALVGKSVLATVGPAPGQPKPAVEAVVMGDSTAAGFGNPLVSSPTALDKACQRSSDSFAEDLAAVNGWKVLNLACTGATINSGILGPQPLGKVTAPPQLAEAQKATNASVVIVSVGADDMNWSAMVELCTVSKTCSNKAEMTFFQQQLSSFTTSYYDLTKQLAALPSHPEVIINLYYNPFDTSKDCLSSAGLDPSREKSLISMLDALNSVLSKGAQASSFVSVNPSFAGHALCDSQPYVQGIRSLAPFHPNAAGELAIALADEHAIQGQKK